MDTSRLSPSRMSSLWRMRTHVRPYYGQMAVMTVAALLATLAGIVIPLVTRQVIDGPIRHGDRGAVWPLGALALLFGLAEAVLVFLRRWTMSASALGLETDVRNVLYRHTQRLPVEFHDRWQSGQLLSRATGDVSRLRRSVGFGLVFLMVNSATFVVVTGLLVAIYWPLALLVLLLSLPLVWFMYRFERQYRVRSRGVQDQQGELTTLVEESAGGIRTIKAFGRSGSVFGSFDDQARRMRDLEMGKIRLLATIWAVIEATGSGKTTLVALVPRLYDVTAGRVTLDGRDIRDLPVTGLREVVGTAFEEPTLFSASVRENLTLGRPEATEAEIAEALSV